MIVAALSFALLGIFLSAIVRQIISTGSLIASPSPGIGSGSTMREKHPVLFWLWSVPYFGAITLSAGLSILCLSDAAGVTNFFEGF